ncbi:hypothetical protein CYLTODRAFT_493511 [Cylindrobasidium torrendii FP15055 ss-10]|uniref:F-box domain-containing protein n=1 Tax=Cylindrobasidium torrendii FP15055 ss-10 TaxID=1314674 RepID=A0A0D7B186_9AGAR|nr:hypothetical protein CYLTODRAFT_493511 [Cylindrobasidium torrendii FP15055 ss-10]
MSWSILPLELKQAVVSELDNVYSLALADRASYAACVDALFRDVKLASLSALKSFLKNVPVAYFFQTKTLSVELDGGEACDLSPLLNAMPRLQVLEISSAGAILPSILNAALPSVHTVGLANIDPQGLRPLSERLVVSFCASLPSLANLKIAGVVRSQMHAPVCYFPVVRDDANIPAHPTFGADLALPNILRIPTLKNLEIRDTPLDDERWDTVPIACSVTNIELDSDDADRVLARVQKTVQHVSLGVTLPVRDECQCPSLTRLHTTPYFPPDAFLSTLITPTLSTAPITRLSAECFADDLPELCDAIGDFLVMRQKAPALCPKLEHVDVRVLHGEQTPIEEDALESMTRLIRLCMEHQLRCDSLKSMRRWPDGRIRANSV